MSIWWCLPFVAGLTFMLTGALRRYSLARQIMDIPNARSSHVTPTPRGGGVAIVLTFLAALPALAATDWLSWPWMWSLLGGGAWVAALGFWDDHRHIAPAWRLCGHFLGAVWVLVWSGGLPSFDVFGTNVSLSWFGYVLGALYLVWMLNLYNFMDGIDGLASIEALCVCLGGALLYALLGVWKCGAVPLVLASSVAGFLCWNFPRARIFMGDAGSGFLGILLGALSLQAASIEPQLFWCWLILLGVFIVDATVTLLRRLLRGERVLEAHRSHAYQFAARSLGRHVPVTLLVAGINLIWLLPIALWVGVWGGDGLAGLLVAYAPLILLAVRLNAGGAEAVA
ncbi:glycosyltransferase family 4 protein [Pseudomonas sp. UL073]|uniref:Glycosyltransferase family 4 protein n=1 Tax=Zestomonas insulae TaxID=2809017 RepID=A0ABS2IFX4_9GAMM|nr:glycosyltransferase family 4 protein [Pseudomonas insulae]MBM7060847.1 glycosyltransferase family 4 protein [Pseudomonas insulae]